MKAESSAYVPRRMAAAESVAVRGLRLHVRRWRADGGPRVVMLHGWADVGASFQFVVDALPAHWDIVAPDWPAWR